MDAYNRPATNAYVQLVQLDSAKDGIQPIDVATTGDGYFMIPNLKSGGQYKLIARTKQGEKLLAGISIRQAPDVHVVIQVKEEFATSSIPPLPSAQEKRDSKPAAGSGLQNNGPPVAIWAPTPQGGSNPTSAAVDLPAKLTVPTPVSDSAPAANNAAPGVTSTPNSSWPPTLQIGGPKKAATVPAKPPQPPPLPPPSDVQGNLAPLVPTPWWWRARCRFSR